MPTLLFCFAHPDDESFLAGGTICRYVAEGCHVGLAVATLGEAGKVGDPPVCAPEDLPQVREKELREAAAILGVASLHLLGYRDRELSGAPPDRIRAQLIDIIRGERPQVVVTFDPNGANMHPDHIAISRFTPDAVAAASDGRWHPGNGSPYHVPRLVWVPGRHPWQWAREADPGALPGVDFVIDTSRWVRQKLSALEAHRTQRASVGRHFLDRPDRDTLLGREFFRHACGPLLPSRPADDLLVGIV
jgi:LmbE family N-acetylglucosaminyl deacetylase